MTAYPRIDRRKSPRWTATRQRTCDELGVCRGQGDCTCSHLAPPEAGNVWFAEPEPPEPMTTVDRIAVGALMLVSVAVVVGGTDWLYQTLFITL